MSSEEVAKLEQRLGIRAVATVGYGEDRGPVLWTRHADAAAARAELARAGWLRRSQ
jgi:hypothetical protein